MNYDLIAKQASIDVDDHVRSVVAQLIQSDNWKLICANILQPHHNSIINTVRTAHDDTRYMQGVDYGFGLAIWLLQERYSKPKAIASVLPFKTEADLRPKAVQ